MKIIYNLPIKNPFYIKPEIQMLSIQLEDAEITLIRNEESVVDKIDVAFCGQPIKLSDTGAIDNNYPDLINKIYRISVFLTNRIFIQTGIDTVK